MILEEVSVPTDFWHGQLSQLAGPCEATARTTGDPMGAITNRLVRRDLQSMGWMSARLNRVRPLLCRGAFMALRVARRQAARSVGRTRRSQANEFGLLARAASLESTRASRRHATARLLCKHG